MWLIGFEFEFNKIKKEHIRSTKFIEKWVKDKTCYIEAVTYPVELLPDNKKRNIIFDLINKDRIILNSGVSGKNCGGHIFCCHGNKVIFLQSVFYVIQG